MIGFIKRLLGLGKKRPRVVCCGGVKSKKRRRRKHTEFRDEPLLVPDINYNVRSQMLKKLGLGYGRPKKAARFREVRLGSVKKDRTREMLLRRWGPLISLLEREGEVHITKHMHYGSLRGRDILKFARRDLRRLGYRVEVRKGDCDGYISISGHQ